MARGPGPEVLLCYGAEASGLALRGRQVEARLPMPVLSGPDWEVLFHSAAEGASVATRGPFGLVRDEDGLAGVGLVRLSGLEMEEATGALYRELFALLGDWQLHRVWNFVPEINRTRDGLENYHRFNIGRRRAYEEWFGGRAEWNMPAASAVGNADDALVVGFLAGRAQPRHVENPEQVPAYRYPAAHGPLPPSFARATVVQTGGLLTGYVAGTASIKGHRSVVAADFAGQLETTLENIGLVLESIGCPGATRLEELVHPSVRVYLRREDDLPALLEGLRQRGLESEAMVLRTEICRRELDVEIELAFGAETPQEIPVREALPVLPPLGG